MRPRFVSRVMLSLAGFALPGSAAATGGLFCRPAGKDDAPTLSLVIGHGATGTMFGATLDDGARSRSTMGDDAPLVLLQSWIDERQVLLELADRAVTERIALFKGRPNRTGGATGTLTYRGRSHAMRCEES